MVQTLPCVFRRSLAGRGFSPDSFSEITVFLKALDCLWTVKITHFPCPARDLDLKNVGTAAFGRPSSAARRGFAYREKFLGNQSGAVPCRLRSISVPKSTARLSRAALKPSFAWRTADGGCPHIYISSINIDFDWFVYQALVGFV
jgi:hypothetical protein